MLSLTTDSENANVANTTVSKLEQQLSRAV